MSMELLSAPYLARDKGGLLQRAEARRAYADQLRRIVLFLPYMAVVDRFQHWVYAEAPEEVTPADLDCAWAALWDRFLPGVDSPRDLQGEKETGWQRKLHIFQAPFYYIEYGLTTGPALSLGAARWPTRPGLWPATRRALALGYTKSLPELFTTGRRPLAFDRQTVGELMVLVGEQMATLEA